MYVGVLEYLRGAIDGLHLFAPAVVKPLPATGGISLLLGPGAPDITFADRATQDSFFVACNSKSLNQQEALGALEDIHKYFTRLKKYPSGDGYAIISISTGSSPGSMGMESDYYLYGSSLKITIYQRGN